MRYILAAMSLALTIPPEATAQESIFDFLKGFGGEKEEQVPEKPTPPDQTSSYFGNKSADLPTLEGNVSHIAGAWTITTERDSERCTLDGAAQIKVTSPGNYTCDLVMRDYCREWHDGIIRQACKVSFDGESILVSATVLESLNGATLSGYSPDDFLLVQQEDGSLVGNHEGYGGYPAIWRRTVDGIS